MIRSGSIYYVRHAAQIPRLSTELGGKARHLQVARALFRLPQIIFKLHFEPRFSGAAKCLFQPYRHLRRHAGMAVEQLRKRLARHNWGITVTVYRIAD